MAKGFGAPTPTGKLVHKLRLMADVGGSISRDRMRVIIESADRLEELDERIAIMTEQADNDMINLTFPDIDDEAGDDE